MISKSYFSIFVFLILSLNLSSQNINSDKIDAYLSHIEKQNLDIGTVSILKDGKEMYAKNFGEIKSNNVRYQIGSVTKLFTATLVFKLIENQKLSLNTKLEEFFPDIKNADKISIQNLLEHSSGLSNYIKKDGKSPWLGKERTDKELLDEIKKQAILFSPNDSVAYSNSGYYLLGKIIEKKTNKKFSEVLKQNITKKLKLKNTHSAEENPQNIHLSHIFEDGNWKTKKDFYFKKITAVGYISSSMKDINSFITALFNAKIIKTESLKKMKPILGKETYGRGLMAFKFHNIYFLGHTGGTSGTSTILIYDDKNKISIALSINGEMSPRNDFANDLIDIIYNNRLNLPQQ